MNHSIEPIGYIESCFSQKFGIPRQPLLCPSATGKLRLLAPFNQPECIEGLEQVSHIWLTFIFHEHTNKPWKPKVRPPRLGGNKKVGVFASRSSFRPNNIGLSVVKLEKIEYSAQKVILYLSGIDLLDKTPVIDIKPYLPYADALTHAHNGVAPDSPALTPVVFSLRAEEILKDINCKSSDGQVIYTLKQLIVEVLQQDPRPAYHAEQFNAGREYNMYLHNVNVTWIYKNGADNKDNQIVIYVKNIMQL